jgi:hypothetical protein
MYGRVHDPDTHAAIEPIYRGSHGKVRLGTACKTWICSAIRAALDEPGSQPAFP